MRIKKYEIDRVIDADDLLIGSDSARPLMPTRNYRIGDLVQFIKDDGILSGLSYVYLDEIDGLAPGAAGGMFSDTNALKQISNIRISNISFGGKDYSPALNTFLNEESLLKISNVDGIEYGFYKVNDFTLDESKKFYSVSVDLVKSFGFGLLKKQNVYIIEISPLISSGISDSVFHNNTKDIQGGDKDKDEYYHLTKKQLDAIDIIISSSPPPDYIDPSLSLQGGDKDIEMGGSVDFNLSSTFKQNDAGPMSSIRIEKRTDLEPWSVLSIGSSVHIQESQIRENIKYRAVVDYESGECKENIFGNKDCRGRIEAGSITSGNVLITPYYKYFFGPSDMEIEVSSDARDLSQSGFDKGGELDIDVSLVSGKTQFFLFVRSDRMVSKVSDLSIQNIDITQAYINEVNDIMIEDAGGEPVSYKKYKFNLSDGYKEDHIHRITIKNN